MNLLTKAYLLQHVIRWRLSWNRHNTHYRYTVPGNPRFMGPRDAVTQLIRDGDLIGISGLGAHQRASILYWAIRELFLETGHPRDLNLLTVAGQGGRGRMPGTVEEMGVPGLVRCLTAGHQELFKAFLKLADEGHVQLQCLPQGVLALLVDAQARGEDSIVLETGVGTFVDPRTGRGSPLTGGDAEQLVSVEDGRLRYRLPKIDVALFNAPAADREGNIYVKNCAMIGESFELAKAAKRNNGKVIVNVGLVVDKDYDEVFLSGDDVDAIVVSPETEQTGTVSHRRYWSMFTMNSTVSGEEGMARARFVSSLLGITPRRGPADDALARLAASLFAQLARKGDYVNIGVGLPEEACRLIFEAGLIGQVNPVMETGVLGGVPLPGIFFGSAACPSQIISTPKVFKLCYEKLDLTILGLLQVDSHGNVNASKRGEGAINYVGSGGFIDLATAAKTLIFVGSWMAHAQINLDRGRIVIAKPGKPKFVDRVDEITFNGEWGLKAGKRVFYVTNVGTFRLTERGMELTHIMPGIDLKKDILDVSPMRIVLPESGDVPVVDRTIVTGEGFRLVLQA